MASNSSKALPYLGVILGVIVAGLTFLGYGSETDKAIAAIQAITPLVAPPAFAVTVGGLINKALDVKKSIAEAKSVQEATDVVRGELDAADDEPTA